MEDRAKYVLIGVFTFAVVAAAFGFVYWLHNNAGNRETAAYRVIFEGSVSGLRVGGPVLFNGIRVGEVTDMRLTDSPSQVAAILSVATTTPVRADTRVSLEYAGLTGIASVSLKGATASAPPLTKKEAGFLTLKADPNAGTDMSTAVRETLGRADAVIAENQESIRNSIKNLETFTASLARNSDKIDKLIDNSSQAMGSINDLAGSLKKDTSELATILGKQTTDLATNLDKRTAEISEGINRLTDSANKQVNLVGNNLNRAITNIDKQVTDLAKNPHRIIFGGGNDKK
ncbi:MAG: MlaD family protein [Pseudolabrys sp.]|nr:MlaD family protein [Pseudolabrys sp.]MDP2295962.1 MlaD family protein [Pseudolabrys sp.]